jgi:uncharacterized protein
MYRNKFPTRRRFLKASAAMTVATMIRSRVLHADVQNIVVAPSSLLLLPLGAISPTGWLKRQLEVQAKGLSGHLSETWPDVGPNSAWLGGTGESFERGPYYMDGLVPLAYLLDDARLKEKVQPWMDWSLKSQEKDGNFGPVVKGNDWWPRMVMLKALIQYQEATADPRVIPFMERYFAYQRKALSDQPLTSWAQYRWQDNLLSVLWLFDRNGDPKLLELVTLLRQQGHDWRAEFANFTFTQKTTKEWLEAAKKKGGYHETHGVDIAMGLKSAALWSRLSHDPADRSSTAKRLEVLDEYHGLPNGMYSADEHLAGRNPIQGTELCTVVEAMFSLEQAIAATGDAGLADRLEKIAFNALPGAFSDDMWSHQYDQEPNQIECSQRMRPWSNNGPESNLFGLAPNFGCCTANFHQGWPKLSTSLWMRSVDGGLAAIVYAPCRVATRIGRTGIQIETVTDYPFRNLVEIHLQPESTIEFPLKLRIPQWGSTKIYVNGTVLNATSNEGFITIKRRWSAGDIVRLEFMMEPRMIKGFDNSLSVMRGPLVFSLPIVEKWNKLHDRGLTADWEVLGESSWNYGLLYSSSMSTKEHAVGDVPFAKPTPPVTLQIDAVQIANWVAQDGVAVDFPSQPKVDPGHIERATLVPYASTKLRITAFPQIK